MQEANNQEIQNINNKITEIPEEEGELYTDFDAAKLFIAIKNSILWIILIFAGCFAAIYTYLYYTIPIYRSTSNIQLEMKGTASYFGLGIFRDDGSINEYLAGEIEFIKSNVVYDHVIHALNLGVSCYAMGRVNDSEMFHNSPFQVEIEVLNRAFYNRKIYIEVISVYEYRLFYEEGNEEISKNLRFATPFKDSNFKIKVSRTPNFSPEHIEKKFYFLVHDNAFLQNYLATNLQVDILNLRALTLGISFSSPNPQKARSVVNAVDSAYLRQSVANANRVYKQATAFLQQQLDTTENYLEHWGKKIEDHQKGKGNDSQNKISLDAILGAIQQAQEEKFKRKAELGLYQELNHYLEADSNLVLTANFASRLADKNLQKLIVDLNTAKLDFDRVKRSYTPKTTVFDISKQKFLTNQTEVVKQINLSQSLLYKEIYKLDSLIFSQRIQIPEGSTMDKELRIMNRYYTSFEKQYETILNRIIEQGIAEASTVPNFHVLSTAFLPEVPIYPIRGTFYTYSMIFAAAISLLLIIVNYLFQNKIGSLKELEKLTSAPILGIVPNSKRKMTTSQLVVDQNPKSSMNEAMRSIRTNLDFMLQAKFKRIISVTSTISGEGKTFTAVNLAGIMALSGSKVIVLDLDLRKPKLHFAFGAENTEGMSTLLIGKSSIESCLRQSVLPNLQFITSGPHPPNPAELLISEEFNLLVEKLKLIYDVIVFDTPPIGIVTDGIIAMRKADLPIYVVRAGYSKRSFVNNINRILAGNNFAKLSLVLNGIGAKGTYGSYGYGYGSYGYGGYSYGYKSGYYEDHVKDKTWKEKLQDMLKNTLKIFKRNKD